MLDNISGEHIVGACYMHLPDPILWEVAMVVFVEEGNERDRLWYLCLLPHWSIDVPLEQNAWFR